MDLSVCVLNENGEQQTLYKTQFAYVTDQKQYMAQLLLGSVSEGEGDGYPIFPPLPSAEALREYDQSLTEALMDSELPTGWTLVGYNNRKPINSIQGIVLPQSCADHVMLVSRNTVYMHCTKCTILCP